MPEKKEQAEVAGQVVASVRKSLRDVLAGKIEEQFFSAQKKSGWWFHFLNFHLYLGE